MDPSISPFNASVAVYLASTGDYSVQYTLDPMTMPDADCRWFDDANLGAGTVASGVTNYMFPVTKIRIVIVANGSSIELKALQGFTTN
jgi:hypothetical protein